MSPKEVDNVCNKVKQVQDILQRELILENATYYYELPK